MNATMTTAPKTRKRISRGQLLFSTNKLKNDLCHALTIEIRYNPLTYRKLAAVVVN